MKKSSFIRVMSKRVKKRSYPKAARCHVGVMRIVINGGKSVVSQRFASCLP